MLTRSSHDRTSRDRVLVIAPHGSYRTAAFISAANKLSIDVLIASQGEHSIVSDYVRGLHIDFQKPGEALNKIYAEASKGQFSGVIGTDDVTIELAASAAEQLQLPHNPPAAVKITQRKDLARLCLKQAKVKIPAFDIFNLGQPVKQQSISVNYPAVVKPVALSASRGVIRVNNTGELEQAVERVSKILEAEKQLDEFSRETILLEEFIPGQEVAIEAMLHHGELEVLAIFDKPDPLDGPYFEETYYVTPTAFPENTQAEIKHTILASCQAYGLVEGPVHAECRINEDGVWVLEVAARTIGGLCGRLLSLGTGYTLEELVLLQAMGKPVKAKPLESAAGVLMIPIPKAGILKRVEGILQAQRVAYINEVSIEVREGYELVPLPEGNSYLGFIFAEAPDVEKVEQALREAHDCLNIVIAPLWKIETHQVVSNQV